MYLELWTRAWLSAVDRQDAEDAATIEQLASMSDEALQVEREHYAGLERDGDATVADMSRLNWLRWECRRRRGEL